METTVEIPSGVTLTVQPGVVVEGQPFTSIFVRGGHLVAVGTPSQPITFTSVLNESPSGNDHWNGIFVNWDSTGATATAQFDNAIIGHAQGVALEGVVDGLSVTNTLSHNVEEFVRFFKRVHPPRRTSYRYSLSVGISFNAPTTTHRPAIGRT